MNERPLLSEQGQPNGVEFIDVEVAKRLTDIQAIGFDVDDLLIQRNEWALRLKLELFYLWLGATDTQRTELEKQYQDMIIDPTGGEVDDFHASVAEYFVARGQDPDIFASSLDRIMHGHFDDVYRNQQISETYSLEPEDFWRQYYRFSSQAQEDTLPAESLFNPFPGAIDLLRATKDQGLALFVVTNSSLDRAQRRLSVIDEQFSLEQFDMVVSARDLSERIGQNVKKPNPEALTFALDRIGITSSETGYLSAAYLGNGLHDAEAAQRASIAVPVIINSSGADLSYYQEPHLRFSTLPAYQDFALPRTE